MESDARSIIERYFEWSFAGDPRLADLLADDIEWWVPDGSPLRGTWSGKDAVQDLLVRAFSLYDASSMQAERTLMIAEGPNVCVLVHLDARTASGKPWSSDYAFVFRVEDGKIRSVREYADTARLVETVFS